MATIPASPTQTEIDAVNFILGAIGQAPVTTLEATNPDVADAYDVLINTSKEVQSEGWTYNTEYHYELVPDSVTKHIAVPSTMIYADISKDDTANRESESVVRDGKLYDRANHTYQWERNVNADIVWLFDLDEVPIPVLEFIKNKAAAITSMQLIGDDGQYQKILQRETYSRAQLLEYECNQGDHSFFGTSAGQHNYISYQPYNSLLR